MKNTFADYFSVARLKNQKLVFTSMQPEVEKQFQQLWEKQTNCPIPTKGKDDSFFAHHLV
jgi:SulP family sulfate permease